MVTVASNSSSLPEPPHSFCDEIHALVNATAPRLFAVVEEYATEDGDRDARVAAWGLAHEDGSAQVAAWDGGFRMSLRNPERAAQLISMRPGSVGSLVWPQTESDMGGLLA
ncbi:hypothetical protein R6V09_04865 [Streptomyces sp. W16]|uniref:hypothetical protein n=1 Tax=Streptomyces sp. W16 TaxID=3076631 RepID=UPI00295BEA37|nr:hypothetical protein [Streptomyces sp. W16]MDV9169467.1 hypothetical protein [Streptomyces sp. W16]